MEKGQLCLVPGQKAERLRWYSLAEKDYSEAIILKPEYHKAYVGRAEVRALLGNLNGAREDNDMARKLSGS